MKTTTVKVIQWVPRQWWLVNHDARPGHGFTPLCGPYATQKQAERARDGFRAGRADRFLGGSSIIDREEFSAYGVGYRAAQAMASARLHNLKIEGVDA